MVQGIGTSSKAKDLALWIVLMTALAAPVSGRAQDPGGELIRQQDLFRGVNVLSPRTHDDWPFTGREGETVLLSVESESFDPAVKLVGPNGQVVAENDDVRRGVQNALLLSRLDAAGEFQVRVLSSNRATGGQYVLTVRRFIPTDLAIGSRATGTLGRSLARWHRCRAEAGQTLVLTARAAGFKPFLEVVAPNGENVAVSATGAVPPGSTRAVFRATQAGPYHARISSAQGGDPRASYALTAATARAFETAIGDDNPGRAIDAGGLDLWTFQGNAGDLVRLRAVAPVGSIDSQIAHVPPVDKSGRPRQSEGQAPPVVLLPSDPKSGGELVALLNTKGTFQVAVSQPLGVPVSYTFAAERPARPLAKGVETTGSVGLGGADYWTLEATAGQIARVESSSTRFDTELELYGPQGDLVLRNDDGAAGRDAQLTALLTERGRYLVRVHAHGDGGSGPYTLRRVADPVRPLALGARGEGRVGAGGTDVWSFAGRAGQTMIVSARSSDFNIKAAVFGPDAAEVAGDDDGGEGTDSLLATRLPVDGAYTIWVSTVAGAGRYSLQIIEPR